MVLWVKMKLSPTGEVVKDRIAKYVFNENKCCFCAFILLSIINVSGRAIKGSAGSHRADRGWLSDAASLGAKKSHGQELWQCPNPNSLGDLGLSGSPFPHLSPQSGHLRPVPVSCLAGGPCWWPLLPQPLGKPQCRNPLPGKMHPVHPSTLKTSQATHPNPSPVLTLLLPVCSSSTADPTEQLRNVSSSVCFQTQAGCFQHIPSFPCEQTTV